MSIKGQVHSLTIDLEIPYFDSLKHLLKRQWVNYNQISYGTSRDEGNKNHMIDMAVMPINGKSLKIFSQEQIDRWP